MFEPIEYLDWIRGRPEVTLHDLGSSDLRGERSGSRPVPEPLGDLDDPPAGVNLHTLLATAYGVDPQRVLVTAGASHANFLAAATALARRDGDGDDGRVLVESPGYEPLVATPAGLGATVDRFERPGPSFDLDADRVADTARGETALVTVTNRHNPSGRLVDRATLADAAAAAGEAGARLLVDEVYAPVGTDPRTGDGTAFGGPTAAGLEGAVVTGSLTKFFGLGELRVGWLVADEPFVEAARRVMDHVPAVAPVTASLAERAVYAAGDLAERQRELVAANADQLAAFVEDRPDVAGRAFDGSTFALLDPAAADGDAVAEAAWEAGVLVVPGRFFGADDRVRVSVARDPEAVGASLRAFGGVLDDLT